MESPLGSPTVLIVEDEALLILYAQQMLEEAGFTTLTAPHAEAAFRLLETHNDIDVLLTDINMPGSMDGVALANRVHERWPEVQIAVISGHALPIGLPDGARFFRKPLDAAEVVAELRALLKRQ